MLLEDGLADLSRRCMILLLLLACLEMCAVIAYDLRTSHSVNVFKVNTVCLDTLIRKEM